MGCPMEAREGAELVLAYCARQLDPEKTGWFERHLKACVECQELVAAQKQVWDALDFWDAQPASFDFDRRLEWRIEAEERKQWFQRVFRPSLAGWVRQAIPVATVAAVAMAVFLVRAPNRSTVDFQQQPEAVEVEQAEGALEDLDMIRQFTLPPREAATRNPT